MIDAKKTRWDILERVFWTAVQAGLGIVVVEQLDIPVAYAPIAAVVLAAIKAAVATRVGVQGSASTLPADLDSSAG